jgi:hypothetical protein
MDMSKLIARIKSQRRWLAGSMAALAMAAVAALPAHVHAQSWTFGTAQPAADGAWAAERGTLTFGPTEARLQPDANRRVALLSPAGLPETVRAAEEFVVQVEGTGLQRVRIQARRDARGGWITIADASGAALRATAEGYAIKRNPGTRDGAIERLRIEMTFRTTNPRVLTRIAVMPAKG